jgi:hypothetical protein
MLNVRTFSVALYSAIAAANGAILAILSVLFGKKGAETDFMAVDAVCSEPLSAINSPLTGKSTGNFLDFGLVASA